MASRGCLRLYRYFASCWLWLYDVLGQIAGLRVFGVFEQARLLSNYLSTEPDASLEACFAVTWRFLGLSSGFISGVSSLMT